MTMHTEAGPRSTHGGPAARLSQPRCCLGFDRHPVCGGRCPAECACREYGCELAAHRRRTGSRRSAPVCRVVETNPPMAVLSICRELLSARTRPAGGNRDRQFDVCRHLRRTCDRCAYMKNSSVMKRLKSGCWRHSICRACDAADAGIRPRERIAVWNFYQPVRRLCRAHEGGKAFDLDGRGSPGAAPVSPFRSSRILRFGMFCAVGCFAVYRRSWRAPLPEILTVGVVTLLYAASIIAFFPEFFTVIGPVVRDVYLPVGLSFPVLLAKPALPIWSAAIFVTIVLKRHDNIAATCLLLTTSLGFAAAFALQRKGWPSLPIR